MAVLRVPVTNKYIPLKFCGHYIPPLLTYCNVLVTRHAVSTCNQSYWRLITHNYKSLEESLLKILIFYISNVFNIRCLVVYTNNATRESWDRQRPNLTIDFLLMTDQLLTRVPAVYLQWVLHRKCLFIQLLHCCMIIRCYKCVFTVPLPSNGCLYFWTVQNFSNKEEMCTLPSHWVCTFHIDLNT
jgi:hypothetical protein